MAKLGVAPLICNSVAILKQRINNDIIDHLWLACLWQHQPNPNLFPLRKGLQPYIQSERRNVGSQLKQHDDTSGTAHNQRSLALA